MLAPKRAGRHPSAGTVYDWSLAVVFLTMTALSILRGPANKHRPGGHASVTRVRASVRRLRSRRDASRVRWPYTRTGGQGMAQGHGHEHGGHEHGQAHHTGARG